MTAETNNKTATTSIAINRWMYGAFIVLSAYFIFISQDIGTAAANMGIALIFDPFNPAITWAKRPTWQKIWLIVHVAITLGLFGWKIWG